MSHGLTIIVNVLVTRREWKTGLYFATSMKKARIPLTGGE